MRKAKKKKTSSWTTRDIVKTALTLIPILGLFIFISIDNSGSGIENYVTGVMIGLNQQQIQNPPPPSLLVKLNQGKTVEVRMPPGIIFEKGRRIVLIEKNTK